MCKVNGRQTPSDGKSSLCLWQGELKILKALKIGMLDSSVVECGLEPRSSQTKDYIKMVFVAFLHKHAALRKTTKDYLAWNQDNVSEWSDLFIHGLLCFKSELAL